MAMLGMPTLCYGCSGLHVALSSLFGTNRHILILCAISFMTFDTWLRTLLPPLVYFCLAGLEGYFVTPMILGRRLTLNPIMVFGAILFGVDVGNSRSFSGSADPHQPEDYLRRRRIIEAGGAGIKFGEDQRGIL